MPDTLPRALRVCLAKETDIRRGPGEWVQDIIPGIGTILQTQGIANEVALHSTWLDTSPQFEWPPAGGFPLSGPTAEALSSVIGLALGDPAGAAHPGPPVLIVSLCAPAPERDALAWSYPEEVHGRLAVFRCEPGALDAGLLGWHRVVRAGVLLLLPELACAPCCQRPTCLACGQNWEAVRAIPPTDLCPSCRGRVESPSDRGRLADLARWLEANQSESLGTIASSRACRVRHVMGQQRVRLTGDVLLSHAEEVTPRDATPLGDLAWVYVDGDNAVVGPAPPTVGPNEEVDEPWSGIHRPPETVHRIPLARVPDGRLDVIAGARAILYALSCQTCDDPLIEAILALDRLTPYVDSMLHATTKRGRDHAAHTAAVALLGQFIGDTVVDSRGAGSLPISMAATGGHRDAFPSDADWCMALWFAAMFHDVGYPFSQFLDTWRLSEERPVPAERAAVRGDVPFEDTTRSMVRALVDRLQIDPPPSRIYSSMVDRLLSLFDNTDEERRILDRIEDEIGPDSEFRRWFASERAITILLDRRHTLQGPTAGTDKRRARRAGHVFNHGLISALVCTYALRSAGLDPASASTPTWLRSAIQAIAYHDYEMKEHADTDSAGGPVCRQQIRIRGKEQSYRHFSFDRDPLTHLIRLCDKIHAWERSVRGKFGLVRESEYADFRGLWWPLRAEPTWREPPSVGLVFNDYEALELAQWRHRPLSDELRKYLAELPFPSDWSWPGSGGDCAFMRFQITLPEVDPAVRSPE